METFLLALIGKLDPSHIVFLVCGYGIWKLATGFIDKFSKHADEISDSLKTISIDCSEMRVDLAVIVSRVNSHEDRINNIERKVK